MPAPRSRQTLQILHAALTMSTVIYGVIAFVATPARDAKFHRPDDLLLYVLAFLGGAILLVGAPIAHRVMMPPRERVPTGSPPDLARLTPAIHARIRVGCIVTWALCESVAVLGLVGAFLYRDPILFVPFGGAAIAALLYFAPRQAMFDDIARAVPA